MQAILQLEVDQVDRIGVCRLGSFIARLRISERRRDLPENYGRVSNAVELEKSIPRL